MLFCYLGDVNDEKQTSPVDLSELYSNISFILDRLASLPDVLKWFVFVLSGVTNFSPFYVISISQMKILFLWKLQQQSQICNYIFFNFFFSKYIIVNLNEKQLFCPFFFFFNVKICQSWLNSSSVCVFKLIAPGWNHTCQTLADFLCSLTADEKVVGGNCGGPDHMHASSVPSVCMRAAELEWHGSCQNMCVKGPNPRPLLRRAQNQYIPVLTSPSETGLEQNQLIYWYILIIIFKSVLLCGAAAPVSSLHSERISSAGEQCVFSTVILGSGSFPSSIRQAHTHPSSIIVSTLLVPLSLPVNGKLFAQNPTVLTVIHQHLCMCLPTDSQS